MVFHLLFSWSSFLSWIFFIGDLVLIGFLALKAYQDAEILDRYRKTLPAQPKLAYNQQKIDMKFPFSAG